MFTLHTLGCEHYGLVSEAKLRFIRRRKAEKYEKYTSRQITKDSVKVQNIISAAIRKTNDENNDNPRLSSNL